MELIVIQQSFRDVIGDVVDGKVDRDCFWVSRRIIGETDQPSDQFLIHVSKLNSTLEFFSDDPSISFSQISKYLHEATILGKHYYLKTPKKAFSLDKKLTIDSICISPHQELYGYADSDGSIAICDLITGEVKRKIENGHFSNITKVTFFPSSKVLLSVGIDLQIKLWSILDGSNPRTMMGHTARITDSHMIGAGRNILTSSLDGSIRLWECGSGGCIHEFRRIRNLSDPVNCFIFTGEDTQLQKKTTSFEFEVNGKYVFAGYESGVIQQFNIGAHTQGQISFASIDGFGVTSLAGSYDFSDEYEYFIIAGYKNGFLRIWSTKNLEKPVAQFQITSGSPVTAIELDGNKVYISAETDAFLEYDLDELKSEDFSNPLYLVGLTESCSINQITASNSIVMVGGKYGTLARY